jgi:hypothetical protein
MGDWQVRRGEREVACGDAGFGTQMGEALFICHGRTFDSHCGVGDHLPFGKTVKRCCSALASFHVTITVLIVRFFVGQ